jgi:hypothetical protein
VKKELYDGLIDCQIWHSDISRDYSALSYVWGHASGQRHIFLNGRVFPVRKNLWDFLDVARRRLTDTAIWIDAICIAQDDLDEKNHQVQMMSTIYSQAKKVHVWLGSEGSFAGQAMELIRENADLSDEDIIGACMQNREFSKGVEEIQGSDYWHRAGTLQEFVLPRRVVLMANEGWTDFEAFRRLIDRIRAMMRRSRDPSLLSWCSEMSIFGGQDFWVMRENSTEDRPMNLFSHGTHDGSTGWLRPRACSDVRDRIFANIAFTKYGSSFKVDYSLNPLKLLLESLWLEHDQDTMAEQMALSARLLSIMPMSIMLYSDTRRQRLRDFCSGKTVDIPADVDLLHLRSASSDLDSKRWLSVADPRRVVWSTFSHPCDWK